VTNQSWGTVSASGRDWLFAAEMLQGQVLWRRDGASRKALDLHKCVSRWWTVVFIEDTRDDGPRTILRTAQRLVR
jgi:hypothetical protein